MSTPPPWRAADYDALPLPHEEWGAGVIERIGVPAGAGSDPVVVDAGCGTGRDAERLLHRYSGVRVVGVDADEGMLRRAVQRLAGYGERARVVRADLGRPLDEPERAAVGVPVDAVMSIAAFHWIPDTPVLATNLAALLRAGGRLVAECGGAGQLAAVDEALAGLGEGPVGRTFRGPDEWAAALETAGFAVERAALRPHPVTIDDLDVLARFLATVVLRLHVERRPEADRLPFARAVAERLPDRTVDYVRLEVEATLR